MSILINAYCTHSNPDRLNFEHTINNKRDLSDPELADHLNGFQGYILEKGGQEMSKIKYHLLRHIQRVKHQFSFNIEDSELDALAQWALASNAVLFLTDGTVRSPTGNVLFYPDGRSPDENSRIPFLQESYHRRSITEKFFEDRNIPVPNLPPLPCEHEIELRTESEIFHRALALFVVAVRAESLATGEPLEIEAIKERISEGFTALSPLEEQFLYSDAYSENEVVQFAWRYEALLVLLWVMGLVPELPFPDQICDVPKVAEVVLGWESWKGNISIRSISEVLDALDQHYRLHWICRQADLDGRNLPAELDRGVVLERHYALNWLISFENADWDEVDTPT